MRPAARSPGGRFRGTRRHLIAAVLVTLALAVATPAAARASKDPYPRDSQLRVNDIQTLGTHNSYHQRPPRQLPPGDVSDYEHPPLET